MLILLIDLFIIEIRFNLIYKFNKLIVNTCSKQGNGFVGCNMPSKDLHGEPFSEETLTKLDIFDRYLESWLPVFIYHPKVQSINICDFCAGAGTDAVGCKGSPLRIFHTISTFKKDIIEKDVMINVILNELDLDKYERLRTCADQTFQGLDINKNVSIKYYNEDFKQLLVTLKSTLCGKPNLIFIDQSGIKLVTEDIFLQLLDLPQTDFLFFVSSSYFKRFASEDSFKKYFPDMDPDSVKRARQSDIHNLILEYYRGKIPKHVDAKLYPFTIKKAHNIYGLIFCSKHTLGHDKFLKIAWDKNKLNGEANFDIKEDLGKAQLLLFENKRLTKLELFTQKLRNYILSKDEISNLELYDFTLNEGFVDRHAKEIVKQLKEEGHIHYSGTPNISYNKCYKNRDIKIFKVVSHE